MRKLHLVALGALWLGGLASCKQSDVGPSDDAILQSDIATITTYANSNGLNGSITQSGVYYAVTKPSASTAILPSSGQEVEFNYILSQLIKNDAGAVLSKFVDSTFANKSSYSYIVSGSTGLTEGLLKMHEGEQGIVLLPSTYAFGRTGSGVIPANTPIRLDVRLKRTRTEDQQLDDYMSSNNLTPTEVTPSGLRFIRTVTNTTGATSTPTQTLTIRYRGQLLRSPTAFDSTGTGTYSSVASQFVPGFAEGVAKLRVGEKATLLFPSRLGYGSTGYQVIPAYAPLRFDVELVSVQ